MAREKRLSTEAKSQKSALEAHTIIGDDSKVTKPRAPAGRKAQVKPKSKPTGNRSAVKAHLSGDEKPKRKAKKSAVVVLKLTSEQAIEAFVKLATPKVEVAQETATRQPELTLAVAPTATAPTAVAPTAAVLKARANREFEENQAKPKPSGQPAIWADVRFPAFPLGMAFANFV